MEVLAIISTLIQEPVSLQEIQQAYSYVSTSQKVHYRTSKQLAEGLGTLLLLAKEPFPDLLKISLSPEQLLGYAQQYWGQALIQLILKGTLLDFLNLIFLL
jgi:hypothetical protein